MHSRSVELRSSGTTAQQDKGNGVPILFSISPKAPSIRLIARYHGLHIPLVFDSQENTHPLS